MGETNAEVPFSVPLMVKLIVGRLFRCVLRLVCHSWLIEDTVLNKLTAL